MVGTAGTEDTVVAVETATKHSRLTSRTQWLVPQDAQDLADMADSSDSTPPSGYQSLWRVPACYPTNADPRFRSLRYPPTVCLWIVRRSEDSAGTAGSVGVGEWADRAAAARQT
jgi:hypothetical protein